MRTNKILITLIFLSLFCGCSLLGYRPEVMQGNIMTPAMLAQLRPGLSAEAVRNIMGTPVLINTFNENRWNYVYTFKRGHNRMLLQRVVIHFARGRVVSITQD